MTEPATTLDTRFSEPGTSATDWQETTQGLENAQLFWIATVRADDRPHVSPSSRYGSTTPTTSQPAPSSRKLSTSSPTRTSR